MYLVYRFGATGGGRSAEYDTMREFDDSGLLEHLRQGYVGPFKHSFFTGMELPIQFIRVLGYGQAVG